MTALVGFVVGVALGLVQLGAAPVLFGEPRAAPLIPIAVLAGWSATRGFGGVAAGLLGVALVLGVASEDRAGWFVLAMVPAAALLAAADLVPPRRRILVAPAAASLGAGAYTALLYITGGRLELLSVHADPAVELVVWTGALAAACAVLTWPLRPREPRTGLFP